MTSRLRGTIIKTPDSSPGLLIVGGHQKTFTLEGLWKSPVAPAVNMAVDVDTDEAGVITGISAVDQQQVAKEKLNQIGGVAQEHGKQAAELARQGVGALAARMGNATLGAAVLLWIAWFFLASLKMGGEMAGASRSFTFWDLLGLDPNSNIVTDPASHGLFGLLGLIAIAAPFCSPFLQHPKAKYLYAAPLGYMLIALFVIHSRLNGFFEHMGGTWADATKMLNVSYGLGAYLLAATSIFLAARLVMGSAPAATGGFATSPTGRGISSSATEVP
jgi:hypothetical protein